MSETTIPITLLKGDDEVVLRDAVRLLVDDLVGDDDRSLMVEEVEVGAAGDDGDPLLALVDAAQTPPLFTEVRVVLGRVTEKRERGELVGRPVAGVVERELHEGGARIGCLRERLLERQLAVL